MGGGIWGEAVNGGAVLGGITVCFKLFFKCMIIGFVQENRLTCNSLGQYCIKQGISLKNGDMKNVPFTTIPACKEECAKTEGCVAFGMSTLSNKCYIKNKDHAAEAATATSTSARMSCTKGKCFYGVCTCSILNII